MDVHAGGYLVVQNDASVMLRQHGGNVGTLRIGRF
jgi:hypothetical protein